MAPEDRHGRGVDTSSLSPSGSSQNAIGICKRAFDVAYQRRPVPIRHIALYTPNPQRLADFYCKVLDMKEVERTDRSSIFVSDGYFNLALLYQRKEEPIGLNHFGFHVKRQRRHASTSGKSRGSPRRCPPGADSVCRISRARPRGKWHRHFAEGLAGLNK